MTPLTASTVRRHFEDPAFFAVGHNLHQARLIASPDTPEADSLVELLGLLRPRGVDEAWALARARRVTTSLNASNAREGLVERDLLFEAAQLATDLRARELNGSDGSRTRQPQTAKAIAARLREPLRVLAHPLPGGGAEQLLDAAIEVADALSEIPALQLRHPAVQYELGKGKYRLLDALIRRRAEKAGTGHAANAAGPQDPSEGSDHGTTA